jgi:hypothetical protein
LKAKVLLTCHVLEEDFVDRKSSVFEYLGSSSEFILCPWLSRVSSIAWSLISELSFVRFGCDSRGATWGESMRLEDEM